MGLDTIDIIAIVLGNGALTTIILAVLGYVFQRQQHNSEKDFDARKAARAYYKTIYGHIAILTDLAKGYRDSLAIGNKGKAEVTDFEKCKFCEMTSTEILKRFNEAYLNFENYYVEKKKEGFEIFIPKKLQNLLIGFWSYSLNFYQDNERMKDLENISDYIDSADETTDYMEKLFGFKGGINLSIKKRAEKLAKTLKSHRKT